MPSCLQSSEKRVSSPLLRFAMPWLFTRHPPVCSCSFSGGDTIDTCPSGLLSLSALCDEVMALDPSKRQHAIFILAREMSTGVRISQERFRELSAQFTPSQVHIYLFISPLLTSRLVCFSFLLSSLQRRCASHERRTMTSSSF